MYDKVLKTVKEALEKAKAFDNNPEDVEELRKALRDLKINLDDGLLKVNDHGQWSMSKMEPNKPGAYDLSSKWKNKIIPEAHPDRKAMVGHINDMNQSGNHAEARRMYDQHISGGGAYSKGTTEKAERSDYIEPKDKPTTEDKIAKLKWDHNTQVDDVAGKNTKLEENRFKRNKPKV